jgi:copper chaperone
MTETTVKVDGMSCEHCVSAVKNAVGALDGITSVEVDLSAKTVKVVHDPAIAPIEKIKFEIEEQGYEVME